MPRLVEQSHSQLEEENSAVATDPTSGKVFVTTGALSGPVPIGYTLGLNEVSGVIYFEDSDGNWAEYYSTLTVTAQPGQPIGTSPVSPPTDPNHNDIVIEVYDDYKVWWRFLDGAWFEVTRLLTTYKYYRDEMVDLEALTHVVAGHLVYVASKFSWYIKNDLATDFAAATGWDWVRYDCLFSSVSYLLEEHYYVGTDTDVATITPFSEVTEDGVTTPNFGVVELLVVTVNGMHLEPEFYTEVSGDSANLTFASLESELMGGDTIAIRYPVAIASTSLDI